MFNASTLFTFICTCLKLLVTVNIFVIFRKIELISEYAANSDSDNDDKNSQPLFDQNKATETLPVVKKNSPTRLLDQNPQVNTLVVVSNRFFNNI